MTSGKVHLLCGPPSPKEGSARFRACLEGLGAGSRSSRKSISTVGENHSCLVVRGGGATSGAATVASTLKNGRDCRSLAIDKLSSHLGVAAEGRDRHKAVNVDAASLTKRWDLALLHQ